MSVDTFTRNHLKAWADNAVYDDERERFIGWVLAELADDPTLADLGWPGLYRSWDAS